MLKTVKVRRLKFGFCLGQEGLKANIVSKVLIEVKLKLVVMSKDLSMAQLKLCHRLKYDRWGILDLAALARALQ